jgi:flagellar protein FlaI
MSKDSIPYIKRDPPGFNSRFTGKDLCSDMTMGTDQQLVYDYEVEPPFGSVQIVLDKGNGTYFYKVKEPILSANSRSFSEEARRNFVASISSYSPRKDDRIRTLRTFLREFAGKTKAGLSELELEKVFYFLYREFEGYGPIEVPLLDDNIEDISCVGPNAPLYVVHRKFGSVVSNIIFERDSDVDDFVRNLVQRSGKHISIAVPMVDCSLPTGARLQATLGREITKNGSSFTIRRFRDDPLTPTDLVDLGTMNVDIAVYLWLAIEKGENMFILGGTASGKTTTLNSILLFVPLDKKVVSIEDTKELNIPHENWVQTLTRQGTGDVNAATRKRVGELDMFDLLVNSLRQRPDYIIVGEVRGREAYTVFQSMATGQTVISTFHSNDVASFVHRLEGEPLSIPRSMITSLNIVVLLAQSKVGENTIRRIKKVVEIVGIEKASNEVVTNTVFEWDPGSDKFIFTGHSYFQERMMKEENKTLEHLNDEINKRKEMLEDLRRQRRIGATEFSEKINKFLEDSGRVSEHGSNERSVD